MSLRITSVQRALDDVVPATLDPTAPAVSIANVDDNTSTVNLVTDGTIDWWWFGNQTASTFPYDISYLSHLMKRMAPGWLWDGFRWRFGSGTVTTITGTSSRTMQAATTDNMRTDFTINITNKTGYQTTTTGLGGFGFQMVLPVSETTRRFKAYAVPFACDIRVDALVLGNDGRSASTTALITGAAATTKHSIIVVDFSGPSNGGQFICNAYVETQYQSNPNFQLQALTLSEP